MRDLGWNKVYLNTNELTAYTGEEEVLLGGVEWFAKEVTVGKDGIVVIKLRDSFSYSYEIY